ncbi:MAG: hypothetical protein PHP01_08085, partial [Phycisphaerae bacterium]|nr:hypothetical protein [Phycisphaerae bacterium]
MKITKNFGSYDPKRFSDPWIGKVIDWSGDGNRKLDWGLYFGDELGGTVEIDVDPGDIVGIGQKDKWGGNRTISNWFIVEKNGNLKNTNTSGARQIWNTRRALRKD